MKDFELAHSEPSKFILSQRGVMREYEPKNFYFLHSPFRLNYVPVLNIYGGRSLHTGEAGLISHADIN